MSICIGIDQIGIMSRKFLNFSEMIVRRRRWAAGSVLANSIKSKSISNRKSMGGWSGFDASLKFVDGQPAVRIAIADFGGQVVQKICFRDLVLESQVGAELMSFLGGKTVDLSL